MGIGRADTANATKFAVVELAYRDGIWFQMVLIVVSCNAVLKYNFLWGTQSNVECSTVSANRMPSLSGGLCLFARPSRLDLQLHAMPKSVRRWH